MLLWKYKSFRKWRILIKRAEKQDLEPVFCSFYILEMLHLFSENYFVQKQRKHPQRNF